MKKVEPLAKQYGRHAAPRKTNYAGIALVCLVICIVVGGGVFAAMYFLRPGLSGDTSQQEQSASTSSSSSSSSASLGAAVSKPTSDAEAAEKAASKKAAEEEAERQKREQEAAAKPKVAPATVEVMMIGDVLMHDECVVSGANGDGTYYYGFLFDHITDELAAADVKILNQETVMGEPERGYSLHMGGGGPIMNTPTALADTEVDYGFNVILKATNHTLDLHYSGLGHELDYWKAAHPQIPILGVDNPNTAKANDSQNYVDNVYVGEFNGMKIGILNYTGGSNEVVNYDTDYQYLSFMSEEKIRSDVNKARAAGAEMLIACPHWGTEYITDPSGSEQEMTFSRLFCELGVDVILGCHPHVLQPIELLQNKQGHKTVCYYSMGDFVCAGGMRTDALIGGVARFTLHRAEDGTCSVQAASLHPTVICYTVGPHMSAYPLREWTYDLAAEGARPDLTPDHVYGFLSDVFGSNFNSETTAITLDMNSAPTQI